MTVGRRAIANFGDCCKVPRVCNEQEVEGSLAPRSRLLPSRINSAAIGGRGASWAKKRVAAFLLLVFMAPAFTGLAASSANVTRRMVAVAEVVTGILGYARWPAASESMQLCVVGPTEYADVLLQSGNAASRWKDEVLRVAIDDPQITSDCHALYVGVVDDDERQRLFSRLQGFSVLSISERDDSCAIGSMFCLKIRDESVAFDVNLDAVARSGIKIHPHVLNLGRRTSSP